jgi:hypothetical protein
MQLPPLHQSTALFLSWIGGLCGGFVLLLADVLPFPLPFATPASFFGAVVELEIFFVLVVWPLFIPSLLRAGCATPMLLFYVAILLLFSLPLALIGANVSSAEASALVRSRAHVAALAVLGAGVAARLPSSLPWYFLAVFWVSAAHPFWFFLEHQLGANAPSISVYLSPFWGAAAAGSAPAWVQTGLYGAAGLLLLGLAGKRKAAP